MLTFGQRTFKLTTQAIRNLDFAVGFKRKEHREMNCKFGVLFADERLAIVLMIAVTFLAMVSSSHAFQEDIVGAWPMDEGVGNTVGDFVGNHSDSDIIGDAEWVEGKFGSAIEFDGMDDCVEVEDSDSLNPKEITIALWVKLGEVPAPGHNGIISKWAPSWSGYLLQAHASHLSHGETERAGFLGESDILRDEGRYLCD